MKKFVKKNLESITEKLCEINNNCMGITKDDLNPEIPLSTQEQWKKNNDIYNAYYFIATTASLTAFLGLYGSVKESIEIAYEIGRNIDDLSNIENTKEITRDYLSAFMYYASFLVSASLTKKSFENMEKTKLKKKNSYTSEKQ
ncbi:MAG: hypothetical protein ACOC1P_01995 [Minisyncoccales bacterium]